MTQYFANYFPLKDLIKERNRLAKIHHPDKGGSLQTMQEINAQFETAKKRLSPGGGGYGRIYTSARPSPQYRTPKRPVDKIRQKRKEELLWVYGAYKAEQHRAMFKGCRLHYSNGGEQFFYVTGNTGSYRQWFQEHGFIWKEELKRWEFDKKPL